MYLVYATAPQSHMHARIQDSFSFDNFMHCVSFSDSVLKAKHFDDELSLGADGKRTRRHTKHIEEANKEGNVRVGK